MTAATVPPCGHCRSDQTEAHCRHPQCSWIRCRSCGRLTSLRRPAGRGGS